MATDDSQTTNTVIERYASGGLAGLLVVAGVVLFFFPEPLTSILGVLTILAGIGSWIVGRF